MNAAVFVRPLLLLGLFAVTVRTVSAQSTLRQPRRIRESVSVETDPAVVKLLDDAKEYLSTSRWEPAVDILIRILAKHEQTLVRYRSGLYVTAGRYCNVLLAGLPPAGRAVYRKKIDPQARKWFEAAEKERDVEGMLRVVRRAFASSYGDEALLHLGRWAWERGRAEVARGYWSRILPPRRSVRQNARPPALHYPDTNLDVALIRARCILCDLMGGRLSAAERSLRELQRSHPDARGTIAGRTGLVAKIVQEIARDARKWVRPAIPLNAETFAVNPQRNGVVAKSVDVGAIRWTRNLAWRELPVTTATPGLKRQRHAACYPAVLDGTVFVCHSDAVFAYDLRTGKPAFHVERGENAREEDRAVVYPDVPGERSPQPSRPSLGVPRFSLTVHNRRLYARLGSPVVGRTKNEVRARRSEIICYDLVSDGGRLAWKVAATTFGRGWEFEGSPVVLGERVFVAMRKRLPETEVYVACFDSHTGKRIWIRKVVSAIAAASAEHNHVGHNLLTLSQDTVFYLTHLGAISALDAFDGSVKWLLTYETRGSTSPAEFSNPMKRGLTPCLFWAGLLIAAPTDSKTLFGIDASTGAIVWRRNLRGGVRVLLGVRDNRLFVSGNRLWGLDVRSGAILWNLGFEDPAGFGFARGLLAGEFVFWPLRKEIIVARQKDGSIVRRIALRALHGGTGGNLVIAGGHLIVAEPNRLVVYGQFGGRRKGGKKPKIISSNDGQSSKRIVRSKDNGEFTVPYPSARGNTRQTCR